MTVTALEYIQREHEELESLFGKVSDPRADRGLALKTLTQRMTAHISVERSILGPVIKDRDIGGAGFQKALAEEHKEMERVLVLIERRKVNSPDLPDLTTELLDTWHDHCKHVSGTLVPALQQTLSDEDLDRLGEDMSSAEDVIVSHPHPHLLSLGPLTRFTTRVAARIDRMRDRTVTNR